MTDRNRDLVPDSWNLVRENRCPLDFVRKDSVPADSIPDVYKRAELSGKSVKLKKV